MISYERLIARLPTLRTIADQEFPGDENEERRRLVYLATKVLSPGPLEQWLHVKIKDIHESFDGPVQEEQAPAPKKRKLAPTAEAAPER
ncbi:hypothetical protein PtrSN002B_011655 [Pyrenophora tritici-repentis]|uniref:Uncharacterized protein n=2 Tax=Pyrenophora tritici-repentis TaxID=45151 RepID=A0A2W1CUS7_9PLEO|nr:uncharacterized protein PTRG_03155 [Pyrenophora tritici-repentis Pt-1C-BFP]KAA8622753.1 hypothetical protein PtrV1_04059 [Pyrenophora tritici-repentis]EDU45678.1 predicted protein [Pyrenophora tritici-repentis Pt-1C-BFP]KAF7451738.1 hypothetical protein A1F99_035150 [Pyrenophora tritici-repentis]KAF7575142.1 hypothetical protein PtrM4_067660 [Pyrenophora tritici-repentis]KAG9386093.1 hypothetical protein A1F94_002843 [Pyrenophora tritici-repentis]